MSRETRKGSCLLAIAVVAVALFALDRTAFSLRDRAGSLCEPSPKSNFGWGPHTCVLQYSPNLRCARSRAGASARTSRWCSTRATASRWTGVNYLVPVEARLERDVDG